MLLIITITVYFLSLPKFLLLLLLRILIAIICAILIITIIQQFVWIGIHIHIDVHCPLVYSSQVSISLSPPAPAAPFSHGCAPTEPWCFSDSPRGFQLSGGSWTRRNHKMWVKHGNTPMSKICSLLWSRKFVRVVFRAGVFEAFETCKHQVGSLTLFRAPQISPKAYLEAACGNSRVTLMNSSIKHLKTFWSRRDFNQKQWIFNASPWLAVVNALSKSNRHKKHFWERGYYPQMPFVCLT